MQQGGKSGAAGLRVAIDARMVRITGIGRYTEELVQSLAAEGVQPTVFVSPVDAAWWHVRHPSIPYRIAPEQIYSWSEQLILPARFSREQFDLVHFTNFNVPIAFRGRFVVTIHDTIPLHYSGERRRSGLSRQAYSGVLRSAIQRAERVIVPSVLVRDELIDFLVRAYGSSDFGVDQLTNKIVVVPHGISDAFCSPVTTENEASRVFGRFGIGSPYALYVGNFRAHKNVETLIQAFAIARSSIPQAELLLVGAITLVQRQALESLINRLELGKSVRFLGAVSDTDLRVLYDGARMAVVPGLVEGFGIPALEAAARGTVVLASSTTPVREFLHDAVLSFDPQDASQLASVMAIAWVNQPLRQRLGAKARSYALSRDWAMVAHDTLEVYQRALARRSV